MIGSVVSLVANSGEAGASGRDCLASSNLGAQDTGLIDTEFTSSSRGNAAGGHRRGRQHERGRRGHRRCAGREVVATLYATTEGAVD